MKYVTSLHPFLSRHDLHYNSAAITARVQAGVTIYQKQGINAKGKEPPMGNILYEHNLRAYEAAVSMLEKTGRAAVIHPTGTGKSFLAFQLCADNPEKRFCLLSPSEYIFLTQMEKWHLAGGAELKNIQFFTYAKLMRMGQDELAEIRPDYIILDEFHRCGAAQWGGGVDRLRGRYPQAKVLGLSATNIRYLDNQRDMAWELFGGNVASELTLGAAVVTGILPAPKYVLSVYSYRKEWKHYETRVRQARNKAVRDKAQKQLEALRRALEKADGLAEVFARHMPERGKYIIFCANYRHLQEMRALATEWFGQVDATPHIYTAYSEDPVALEEFEAFKADRSGHLSLLYCIDMLNEGIHVEGLSGVILLRPTVSPTIYKQQIGRALSAGGKTVPVIFDVVMNIENLCSIGAVEEELREAVCYFRTNGRADEIVTEHFRVIDEVEDCRRLFAQLNETLGASWDAMYALAKEYYAEHGDLEVPAAYATPDGYSLGAWVATQRKVHAGKVAGNLNGRQVERLSAIGMRWGSRNEAGWEKMYNTACAYYREHGDLEVPAVYEAADGCRLGRWIRRQRELYRGMAQEWQGLDEAGGSREKLCKERFRRLSAIGMVWENDDSWERRFALAKEYYEEHGNLEIPADYVVEGIWLGRWLREQKNRFAVCEEEVDVVLDGEIAQMGSGTQGAVGVKMTHMKNSKQAVSQEGIVQARNGMQGTVKVQITQTENNRQCTSRKQIKQLSRQQKEKLRSIGFVPDMSKTELTWREQYGKAEEFYRKHGNLSIPKRYTAENGKKLGIWLQHQRTSHRSGHLAGWQVRMLEAIGMVWEFDSPWANGLRHAQEYFQENGNLAVPNQYVCRDGYRLGKWISNQRCAYVGAASKGLSEEQVRQLEAIGMVWNGRRGRQGGKDKKSVGQKEK